LLATELERTNTPIDLGPKNFVEGNESKLIGAD
jgi:hypothetical protein